MKNSPSIPYDAGAELVANLVENPSAEAAVIDEILDAYSEGDRDGALRLVGRLREARRIRAAAAPKPQSATDTGLAACPPQSKKRRGQKVGASKKAVCPA